jgi:hypothetical protein
MKIEILACNRDNMPRIKKFRQLAEDQQQESELIAADKLQKQYTRRITRSMKPITPDFIVLHPWRNECHDNGYVFIAHDNARPRPRILGWMMLHIRTFEAKTRSTLTIAHVDYISTNHNVGSGIGKFMMSRMRHVMLNLGCDFIELMPLPAVVGFYIKLGYRLQFEKVDYYTLWLNNTRESKRYILSVYENELIDKMERLAAEMESEEEEAFQPIYDQFTQEEKEMYHAMQDDEASTRIGMIITYEESGYDIDEVRKMLN